MRIHKTPSLKVSERVLDLFFDRLESKEGYGFDVRGYIDTFNNCRETGLCVLLNEAVWSEWDDALSAFKPVASVWRDVAIWAFEDRHSDDIVVIVSRNYGDIHHMYSEDSYKNERKFFSYDKYEDAADYIMQRVEEIYAFERIEKERKEAANKK